ncbi:hypothetical protein [Desulfogranum japonicum]|uniref:hypothetical protein n=1 Tax=Desulfogranum japonicum TaxID=231447 RepID=UPI00041415F1|nr:hypothetical protein [Desulfogranum japonicum]
MTMNSPELQSWQVFQAARKYIGAERVARIFNRKVRSAYSWAQNPAFTEHRCKNPLDTLHALFTELDARGMAYVVQDALTFLASSIDDVDASEFKEPLPTITEEILADYTAISTLKDAIDERKSIDTIVFLGHEAEAEIQRTVAKYIQEQTKQKECCDD